ncbi:MAG: hypothetical protein IPM35_12955 [Myxococcales bacterium]|nr:hypothetical protein [Myxococcales bacterium]
MARSYEERRVGKSWWDMPRRLLSVAFTPRVRGVFRVGAYLSVVSMVGAGLAARSAYGSVSEQALATGRQLAKLGEFTKDAERLMLNGQALNMSSATTDLSMGQVLDRFEALCKEEGAVPRDLREVQGMLDDPALAKQAERLNFGVLRQQSKDDGVLACAVKNPANGQRRFWDGMAAFAESWDLADVGHLRYAYVRKLESGRTHVLTAWTDGSFKVDAMVPPTEGADAPGADSPIVARPPSSVRYLSASAEGRPHAIRVYESKVPAKEVLAGYEKDMAAKGFEQVFIGEDAPEARYFSKGGVDIVVVADQNGDRSLVSAFETRGF